MWGDFLLIVSAGICVYLVIKHYSAESKDIKFTIILAVSLWLLSGISGVFNDTLIAIASEVMLVLSVSLVLVVLLMIVRLMRPVVFRYPYLVVFIPLLIPVAYMVVFGVSAMQMVILMVAQGVGLLVIIMLTAGYWNVLQHKNHAIAGITGILLAFLIFWFFPNFAQRSGSFWQVLLTFGMISFVYCFPDIIDHANETDDR